MPGLKSLSLKLLSVVMLWLALFAPTAVLAQDSPQSLESSPLTIETRDGDAHCFTVELAQSDEERNIGLMFRETLAADRGMLFIYASPRPIAMWMKNTYIPLDILFIQADGRVANIAENTTPHSLESIPSRGRVIAALELPAGTAARLGIAPGDFVRHQVFGNDVNSK